jgi:type VI secretion system protein ImpL
VARLDRRLPERLAAEPDLARRALIFGFPAQVAGLADEIVRFAERCFRPTTYEPGAWLRGVYLTSGTQTGTPIDRLMAAVARNIGVAAAPPATVGGDRSFFLRRLLEQVIFGEASLAGRDLARERRDRLLRGAAFASLALVAIGAIGAWGWSFAGNRDRQLGIEGELQAWSQAARPFARTRLTPADADFTAVLPLLDKLGDLKAEVEGEDPIGLRMGLSQRPTTEAQLGVAYRTALANLLLPRLVLATETGLRARLRDPDYVVEALKVYLSLAGNAPVDPALLEAFFVLQAEGRPGGQAAASAKRHVPALIAILPELDPGRRPALDSRLVAEAQVALARVPLPRRAYAALVSNPAVAKLPGWKVTEHAGPTAAAILVRRSGRPLNTEIPAIYTYDGFHQVFLPQLDEVARGVYAEYWVLSGRGTPDASDADIRRLKSDMLRLYYDDAVAAWDGLLRDVALAPIDTLGQAVESTKALSGPNSPLKLLIQAVVRETALTVPPEPPQGQGGASATSAAINAARGASRSFDKLARLVRSGSPAAAAPTEVPGAPVEARFANLRPLVESVNGAPPALDDAASALGALHTRLAEAAASPNPGEAFARMGGAGAPQLAAAAARLPEPAKQMLEGVGRRATDMGRTGARQQLNAVWRTDVLPFCRAAIAGRFPFSPGSGADATADDIARIFGPSGLIEGFIKGQLANFVDTTRQPWRDSQNVGLQPGSLAQLARARRITAALFPSGAGFKASFNLTPVSLSSTAAAATLDVDGQELRYAHGPARPVAFTWPGPSGANTVRLSFAPTGGEPPATMVKEGPWALFRLLNEGRLQRTEQPDVFEAEVGAGGHSLRLRLRAASVENPFDLRVLSGFACPETL